MKNSKIALAVAGLTFVLVGTMSAAQAEMLKFGANLTAAEETPATDSKGMGTAEVTVDTDAKTVSWTVKVDGLTGDATAAHIHGPAAVGEKAGPEIDMSKAIMEGSADITDAQIADIKAGKTYVNIHTAKFPDGEIRGQLAIAK
jgi:Cu/Zn superoxide dismutase